MNYSPSKKLNDNCDIYNRFTTFLCTQDDTYFRVSNMNLKSLHRLLLAAVASEKLT